MHNTASVNKLDLNEIDFICFDCDGVLWRGKEPILEARDLLITLKISGKVVKFITNSSVCTRSQHAAKISTILSLPFEVNENDVITAAHVTAQFLKRTTKSGKSILVMGKEGIRVELQEHGFNVHKNLFNISPKDLINFAAVVVGFDPEFSYNSMKDAITVFTNNPDCILIGCNLDATYAGEGGIFYPGTGSIVKAVEYATGRDPIIIGKPNNYIYDALLDSCPNFDPARAIFIGDRLDSDIVFANKNGIKSVLVETGVHKREDINKVIPHTCISNLSHLFT